MEYSFYDNRLFRNEASVAMNPLVSLFYCLVAENVVTDRLTDTQTHMQTKDREPLLRMSAEG